MQNLIPLSAALVVLGILTLAVGIGAQNAETIAIGGIVFFVGIAAGVTWIRLRLKVAQS